MNSADDRLAAKPVLAIVGHHGRNYQEREHRDRRQRHPVEPDRGDVGIAPVEHVGRVGGAAQRVADDAAEVEHQDGADRPRTPRP